MNESVQSCLKNGETRMHRNYGKRDRSRKKTTLKRRRVETFDDCCLQARSGIWHAVMPVPRDVQEALAIRASRKIRFAASLETDDVDEATRRLPVQINEWRRQIIKARRDLARTVESSSWSASSRP